MLVFGDLVWIPFTFSVQVFAVIMNLDEKEKMFKLAIYLCRHGRYYLTGAQSYILL